MDREEWMYKLPRVGNDLSFLHHVRNFVAAAKKHESWSTPFVRAIAARTNFSRNIMWFQSHLIWQDFVKDYTIWKFHGEADPEPNPIFYLLHLDLDLDLDQKHINQVKERR